MVETIYTTNDPDSLMHHGVKGMKWGVRHDPEPSPGRAERQSQKEAVRAAKKEYKAAKKAYSKEYNTWYYKHPKLHVTKEGKRKEQTQLMKTLVKANDLNVAKGKYMQAKGVAKNHPKAVAKGKHMVNMASNAKKYNVKVVDLMEKGYTFNDATSRLTDTYSTAMKRQQDEQARYRREKAAIKRG